MADRFADPVPDVGFDKGALPSLTVPLTRLERNSVIPRYAQPGDAGADLSASADLLLLPGQRALVGTGVAVALPAGFAAFIHPRSGLAAHVGLGILNAPGTIDAGYRGEIKVILINHDRAEPIQIRRGDRIAQLIIQRVEHAHFVEVDQLASSERDTGGFGSSDASWPGSDIVEQGDAH